MTDTETPVTDCWLSLAHSLPPLTGPASTAERLLLLAHYGIDWQNGWITSYVRTYWDKVLPDRVIASTYRADTLSRWWCSVADELGSQPRNSDERLEIAHHLGADSLPVLEVLRFETPALILRTRITTDAVRADRAEGTSL